MLGAYTEPDVEPAVSAAPSSASRLRERLAAALLTRARSAGNRTGAVACRSAERVGVTTAPAAARARWNTRLLLWVTRPCEVACAAARAGSAAGAAAGCAALLCLAGRSAAAAARRSRAALRLAMQDLPRSPV